MQMTIQVPITDDQVEIIRRYPHATIKVVYVVKVPELRRLTAPVTCDTVEEVLELLELCKVLPLEAPPDNRVLPVPWRAPASPTTHREENDDGTIWRLRWKS